MSRRNELRIRAYTVPMTHMRAVVQDNGLSADAMLVMFAMYSHGLPVSDDTEIRADNDELLVHDKCTGEVLDKIVGLAAPSGWLVAAHHDIGLNEQQRKWATQVYAELALGVTKGIAAKTDAPDDFHAMLTLLTDHGLLASTKYKGGLTFCFDFQDKMMLSAERLRTQI